MSFAIHRDKADILYSKLLRESHPKCSRCGKTGVRLEIHHFWGRRHEGVRFDDRNCDVLCSACHRLAHERPAEYVYWKQKQLGSEYDKLTICAYRYHKRDRKLAYIIIKARYDDMISAKQAKENSDKNSPVKDGNIIMEALDKIDKQIRRVTKKSGRRHVNFQCDNPDMIEPLTFELEKAGYEVSVMEKMVKVEW